MSEVIEKDTTELAELPPAETALEVYQQADGLDPYIERIRNEVMGHEPNTSTRKGREAIASLAFKVRKSKTALDGLGKKLVDDLKEVPKKIDAERKRMREALDALAEEVRRPLTDWEEAEAARIDRHKAGIEWFRLRADENSDLDSAELKASLAEVEAQPVDESWDEFEAEAHRAKEKAVESLRTALAVREKYEADQAELAELRRKQAEQERKDREERIAREAAERAKQEAEAKATAEREAAAQREAQAKAAQEKAERDRQEAIERQKEAEARAEAEKIAAEKRAKEAAEAARLAEVERQRQEQERIRQEQRQREADREHRANINRTALQAFVDGGVPEDCARQAITLIAKGSIPAVSINY